MWVLYVLVSVCVRICVCRCVCTCVWNGGGVKCLFLITLHIYSHEKFIFSWLSTCKSFAWMYVYHVNAWYPGRSDAGARSPELESWMVVNHCVGSGNPAWSSTRAARDSGHFFLLFLIFQIVPAACLTAQQTFSHLLHVAVESHLSPLRCFHFRYHVLHICIF